MRAKTKKEQENEEKEDEFFGLGRTSPGIHMTVTSVTYVLYGRYLTVTDSFVLTSHVYRCTLPEKIPFSKFFFSRGVKKFFFFVPVVFVVVFKKIFKNDRQNNRKRLPVVFAVNFVVVF